MHVRLLRLFIRICICVRVCVYTYMLHYIIVNLHARFANIILALGHFSFIQQIEKEKKMSVYVWERGREGGERERERKGGREIDKQTKRQSLIVSFGPFEHGYDRVCQASTHPITNEVWFDDDTWEGLEAVYRTCTLTRI